MITPKISICLPAYNGEKYLRECIESILNQTFKNIELLIIDDCSSDKTVNIAQEYAAKDSRIRVILNEHNLGLVSNWNQCIQLAKGEWIKFVFQDDLLFPDCLEKMLSVQSEAPSIIFCKRNFLFDNNISKKNRKEYLKNAKYIDSLFHDSKIYYLTAFQCCQIFLFNLTHNRLGLNFLGEPTVVMIHQSLFFEFGLFNNNFIQLCDFEYWIRISINTGLIYVPETLATFRVHQSSTTSKNYQKRTYQTKVIDLLLFIYEVVFNPKYAPLRHIAITQKPSINLIIWLRYYCCAAWLKALISPDRNLLAIWNKLDKVYPILSFAAQKSLLIFLVLFCAEKLRIVYEKIYPQAHRRELKNKISI
jgi:glycosyltransferase involved in cell wall biosynthesis